MGRISLLAFSTKGRVLYVQYVQCVQTPSDASCLWKLLDGSFLKAHPFRCVRPPRFGETGSEIQPRMWCGVCRVYHLVSKCYNVGLGPTFSDRTCSLIEDLYAHYIRNPGCVLQFFTRRTDHDLNHLQPSPPLRCCAGSASYRSNPGCLSYMYIMQIMRLPPGNMS